MTFPGFPWPYEPCYLKPVTYQVAPTGAHAAAPPADVSTSPIKYWRVIGRIGVRSRNSETF